MSIRDAFIGKFGIGQTKAIEKAANEHGDGDRGTDPFKWTLIFAIGYECVTKEGYRKYHGITVDVLDFENWVRENGDLDSHDGNVDAMSALCGAYDKYLKPVAK